MGQSLEERITTSTQMAQWCLEYPSLQITENWSEVIISMEEERLQ